MLFERAVASEGTKRMRLAVLLLCLMYGWAQEEVEEIIGAAEMAEIDAEFGGNASMMSNVTFTENGGNATTVPDATFTETGGSAVVVPPTTSPNDAVFEELDGKKRKALGELFAKKTVCRGKRNVTTIADYEKLPQSHGITSGGGCDVFIGHLWINTTDDTLPNSMARLQLVQGCITVWNSGLRELNLPSLSLLIYNERRCRPYALRFVDNENLRRISFHENFTMPSKHLILLAGKHSLTKESIKPPVQDYTLLESSDDCQGKKSGCKVHYGDFLIYGEDYDPEDDERLSTLERIYGRLVIQYTNLTNLSAFEKIAVVGLYGPAVEVTENHLLEDISPLFKMNIKGPEPVLEWKENGDGWCHSKVELKLLSWLTWQKPYKLAPVDFHYGGFVNDRLLDELKTTCRCVCGLRGGLIIRYLDGEKSDLAPLKNVNVINGILLIRDNVRLYDLRFLENLNSIGDPRLIDAQLQIGGNVHLADAYMENLVEVHGVRLKTCWDLPQRTKNMYKALTKNVTIEAESREKCTHETSKEDSEREEKSKSLPWNQSEIQSLKPCFAENDARLQTLLRRQSNLRDAIAKGSFTNVTLTLCEHFYGYLKMHDDQTGRAISFLQQLKKITGCLDIVNVSKIRTGNTSMSYFDELDLTNLTEIDYDEALCGNFFALRIMRNMFLQRIDINENLILKGAYFIRKNAEKVEVYSGGKLNSTFQWNNPEDCLQDDPTHLLLICKTIIGSVYGESLPPALRSRMFTKEVKRIHGQLIITSTSAVDLSDYQHLTIIAHNKNAVIVNNTKVLRNIGALTKMTITLPEMFPKDTLKEWKPFVLRNNGKLCDKLRYEKILREKVSTPIEFSEGCKIKKRCVGGIVTDIMSLQGCWIIMGGLTIKDYEFESSSHLLRYFEEIEEVEGQLIIMNNTGIKNLAFLKSLLRVSDYTTKRPIFRVADNPNLTSIEPLHKVELEYSPYEVHLVAVIETYSKISDHEQKELGIQGKVEFRVKERLHPTKGRRSKRKRDRKENADNLGVGIALSVGGCLIITIFGYGYSFFAYLREQRELKRRQQPEGGQAAPVGRAP